MQERHAVEQVIAEPLAVVDVEEFGGHEPERETAVSQPGIGQQEEIRIEPGQAVELEPDPASQCLSQCPLAFQAQVMVADVGGIGQDQVEWFVGRFERGEVALDDFEPAVVPEPSGGRGEGEASNSTPLLFSMSSSGKARRGGPRKKSAGAECRIEEADALAMASGLAELHGVLGDGQSQTRGSGELAEPVPLGGRPETVEPGLLEQATGFGVSVELRREVSRHGLGASSLSTGLSTAIPHDRKVS